MQLAVKQMDAGHDERFVQPGRSVTVAEEARNITTFPTLEVEGAAESAVLHQGVGDLQAVVLDAIQESSLDEKVEGLRATVDLLSERASDWHSWRKGLDLETFEQLKHQVEQVQTEWHGLTASLHGQRERLEALLSSFPSVLEVSAVRALGLRLNHLEHLVANMVDETQVRSTRRLSRTQLGVSIAGLSVTVVLWGAFYSMRFLGI